MKNEKVKEAVVEPKLHFDEEMDSMVEKVLQPLHAIISKRAMAGKDAKLDLAAEKLGQCMTALQARTKELMKEGKYGK